MKIYGLFAGINNYPGSDLDLSGCVNDASDLCALISPYCLEISLLLDERATRAGLLGTATDFLGRLEKDDWFIWTHSSHGSRLPDKSGDEKDRMDEVLCPYDYRNPIVDDEVFTLFANRAPGSNVLFITDTCHSGTMYRLMNGYLLAGIAPTYQPKIRFMDPARVIPLENTVLHEEAQKATRATPPASKTLYAPGVIHMAACRETEYSYDAQFFGRPNGAYTYTLLQALKKTRKGGTFKSWSRHVREFLPSQFYPQTPALNAMADDSAKPIPFWL